MADADCDLLRIGALELRFLADDSHGLDTLVLFEFTVPPHARVPVPHYHRDVDEVLYGLAGTLTVTIDGRPHRLEPGGTTIIRRGQVHHHQNLEDCTARVLVSLAPGTISRRYFEEMAAAVDAPVHDPARIDEIMQRYGLVAVPAPAAGTDPGH